VRGEIEIMPKKIDGPGLAAIAVGIIFLYGGVKGYSPIKAFENIIKGQNPNENQVSASLTAATSSSGGNIPTSGGGSSSANQALAKQIATGMGHSDWTSGQQWSDWVALWNQESGWSATAKNPSSGAYGIPQSLPADKMASAGADYMTNPATQIKWGVTYIAGRYGNPSVAMAHERANNWY
jgi:resuscitation-promoting factor RpfB